MYWTGTGSGAVSDILLTIPNSKSIDVTSTGYVAYAGALLSAGWTRGWCGTGMFDINGGAYNASQAQVYDATHVRMAYGNGTGSAYFTSTQWNGSNPVGLSLTIIVPIVGF
jgi:hypothetical protein